MSKCSGIFFLLDRTIFFEKYKGRVLVHTHTQGLGQLLIYMRTHFVETALGSEIKYLLGNSESDSLLLKFGSRLTMSSRPSRRGRAPSLSLTPQPKPTISVEEWEAKAPLSDLHLRSINGIKIACEKMPLPLKVR